MGPNESEWYLYRCMAIQSYYRVTCLCGGKCVAFPRSSYSFSHICVALFTAFVN